MRRRAPEIVAFFAVLYGIFLRLEELPGLLLFGDEFHSLALTRRDYAEILASLAGNGSAIARPALQDTFGGLLGASTGVYRWPAVLGGIAGLAAMYPLSRRLVGRNAAAIATLALALNPLHGFYSHFGRAVSLACLGSLVLVWLLRRVVDEQPVRLRSGLAIAVTAAWIPYMHPSALGVVVAVALGAMALFVRRGRSGPPLLRLVASFAVAALLGVLLCLPAWESYRELYSAMVDVESSSSFSAIDVGRVMFGSPPAAWAVVLGLPLAVIWMLRAGSDIAWLLAPAALVPIAVLPILSPIGSEVAYAYHLLTSVPFVLLILAWAIVASAERVQPEPRAATRLAISLGSGVFVLAHIAGPMGLAELEDGPFANGFIRQSARPGYDAAHSEAPSLFEHLGAEPGAVRIIEAPAFVDLRALVYRNHYLPQGREVLLGFFAQRVGETGPYVALLAAPQIRASGADYLVYHRTIERKMREASQAIERTRRGAPAVAPSNAESSAQLRAMLGEPFFESEELQIWKLPGGEVRE